MLEIAKIEGGVDISDCKITSDTVHCDVLVSPRKKPIFVRYMDKFHLRYQIMPQKNSTGKISQANNLPYYER